MVIIWRGLRFSKEVDYLVGIAMKKEVAICLRSIFFLFEWMKG